MKHDRVSTATVPSFPQSLVHANLPCGLDGRVCHNTED